MACAGFESYLRAGCTDRGRRTAGAGSITAGERDEHLALGDRPDRRSFGTSSPELAVSVQSAWTGNADIALGNVVGSNIFNVLFILGLSALIVPLAVSSRLIRWDVPLMILASVLLLLLGLDGRIGRLDGLLLFSGLLAFTFWCVRQSRRESREIKAEFAQEIAVSKASHSALLVQFGLIVGGLVLLGLGVALAGRWFRIRRFSVGNE